MQNINFPILAIDYGDKHFGLAYCDYKGILASPLTTISITKNRTIDNVIEEILDFAKEYNAKTQAQAGFIVPVEITVYLT